MKNVVSIPVTAKTRIGIDEEDSYPFFEAFVRVLLQSGCDKLIVHARKAWLHGLNPKQNRTIPPVQYDYVYRIKEQYPDFPIVLNGNINTLAEIENHMQSVDGVMLGRLACQNPYALAAIHHYFYPHSNVLTRREILDTYLVYMEEQLSKGAVLSLLLKPLFNFAHGIPGSKQWKAALTKAQQTKVVSGLFSATDLLEERS